jgi:imidazoleglycerol-phosphate dehydratase
MLDQIARHAGLELQVFAKGDLEVDAHHTVEDVGIAIGEALNQALGDRSGVQRFASIAVPLDEALIEAVVDISGRPFLAFEVPFAADTPGLGTPPFDPQLTEEFLRAVVTNAGMTVHINKRAGRNTHHVVEATFKAFSRALRAAMHIQGGGIPSTKGVL